MNILYLYSEVMGYTIATIRALIKRGAKIHIVHWDHKKLTPYKTPSYSNITIYNRSEMNVEAMQQLAERISPDITVVSGWMDKGYMAVSRWLKMRGKIVVSGFDDQWHGNFLQMIAAMLGRLGYFSRYFSHAWVSGSYQFEYARRLGFDKKVIIYDLYSADLLLFHEAFQNSLQKKNKKYPHRFLFVGRFEMVKGLDTLLKAWRILETTKHDWELHLVGNGSLKKGLQSTTGVVVKDFMQPENLMNEIIDAGCFILPSRGEPWGVVVHEFAAAGIPLIVSDVVGAATAFLIPGLNGYMFKANAEKSLAEKMQRIIDSSDQELMAMAESSHNLSHRISPQTSAANLLSIIERN